MSNIQPFFSIIIPTYNASKFIKKCINSIEKQTFKNYEVIFVDDCSIDNTIEVINKLRKKNYYIFKLKKNAGPATARNFAIKKSKGLYLCFLDCDDWWLKKKLETIYKSIKKNHSEIISHNEFLYNKNKKVGKLIYNINNSNFYEHLLLNNNELSTSAVTVKRSFIISKNIYFNESKDYYSVEDYDFWLNLTFKGAKIIFINKFLGVCNLHGSNISQKKIHFLNILKVIYKHVYYIQKISLDKKFIWKKAKLRFELNLIKYFLYKKKYITFIIKLSNLIFENNLILLKFFYSKIFK